jgi:putative urate catabolism protein
MTESTSCPGDPIGYGRNPPRPEWPNGARLAVQFALHYEEGGESEFLRGGPPAARSGSGGRRVDAESLGEYGPRAGFWRLWRLFTGRDLPVTVFGVATALARNPEAVAAMRDADWEIASHGLRWIENRGASRAEEKSRLEEAIRLHTEVTGSRPLGWYSGRASLHTRDLVKEEGGFLYDSDTCSDDLPYWEAGPNGPHLTIPHGLETDDGRFCSTPGFADGEQFFHCLKDAFDVLWEEGATAPKMMSIGLHGRIVGRPGRIAGLIRFLDHLAAHDRVWVARRIDIAWHWHAHHRPA